MSHADLIMLSCSLVPVGTTCQIPTWSLHRDPRHFSPRPEEFWPERWLPEASKLAEAKGEEFILNAHAYMPFNYGSPFLLDVDTIGLILVIRPRELCGSQFGSSGDAQSTLITHSPLRHPIRTRVCARGLGKDSPRSVHCNARYTAGCGH
jgi:hypothetical protein